MKVMSDEIEEIRQSLEQKPVQVTTSIDEQVKVIQAKLDAKIRECDAIQKKLSETDAKLTELAAYIDRLDLSVSSQYHVLTDLAVKVAAGLKK